MPFFDQAACMERATKELFPGILTRTFWGDQMLLSRVELAPHAVATAHSHPHEQAGVVLSGEMELTIEGETQRLGPGDFYLAPGDAVHEARAGAEGCVALEIFSPVRELLQY